MLQIIIRHWAEIVATLCVGVLALEGLSRVVEIDDRDQSPSPLFVITGSVIVMAVAGFAVWVIWL